MDELVTVFRSADEDAEDDANEIADALRAQGITATVLNDDAPGVLEGSWEVRVPPTDVARAESLIAAMPDGGEINESPDLDLVTVFSSADGTSTGDMETLTVKNLLEAAGIYAVLVGGQDQIPSLSQQVRVARDRAEEARRIIREARASGSSAAAEAEAESESSS